MNGYVKRLYNRHLWTRNRKINRSEFERGSTVLKSKPICLQLEPGTACNLHCVMCRNLEDEATYRAFMDAKVFDRLYESGWLSYLELLQVSGWGETFLNPEIRMLLQKCSEFQNLKIQITTNGLLLNNGGIVDILCMLKKVNLIFSIDSANPASYEKIRRGASWRELINNILLLNYKREETKSSLTTECHCLVNVLNLNSLKDMVDFALKYKFYSLSFMRLHDCREFEVPDEVALPALRETLAYAHGKNLKCSIYEKITVDGKASDPRSSTMVWRCVRPWKHIIIRANGDVAPCCYLANKKCGAIMGNIKEQSLAKIWNSDKYSDFRKSALNGFSDFCNRMSRGCKAKTKFIQNVKVSVNLVGTAQKKI